MQQDILNMMQPNRWYAVNDYKNKLGVKDKEVIQMHLASLLRKGKIIREDIKGQGTYQICKSPK